MAMIGTNLFGLPPGVGGPPTPVPDGGEVSATLSQDPKEAKSQLQDALARWTHSAANVAVFKQVFGDFDPSKIGQPGPDQSNYLTLVRFCLAQPDPLIKVDAKGQLLPGALNLPPASAIADRLKTLLAHKAPTDGVDSASTANGGQATDGLSPSATPGSNFVAPKTLLESDERLATAKTELQQLQQDKSKLKGVAHKDERAKLDADITLKQQQIGKLQHAQQLFTFGTPVSDTTTEASLKEPVAKLTDKKFIAIVEVDASQDPGAAMLGILNVYPNATADKRPVLERVAGSPEAAAALALDLKRYVATGELSPALQKVLDDAQVSPRGFGSDEATAHNDNYAIATFLYRVKARGLEQERTATEHALNQTAASKSLTPEQKKEQLKVLRDQVKQLREAEAAALTAFQPVARVAIDYEHRYFDGVQHQANGALAAAQKAREHGDVTGADKLEAQAKKQAEALVTHDTAVYDGALKLHDGGRSANTAARNLVRGYRLSGQMQVDAGERTGQPLKSQEVPAYTAALSELEKLGLDPNDASHVNTSLRGGEWHAAKGSIENAGRDADERWAAITAHDPPPPTVAQTEALRTRQAQAVSDAKAAASLAGLPFAEADAQKIRNQTATQWNTERDQTARAAAPKVGKEKLDEIAAVRVSASQHAASAASEFHSAFEQTKGDPTKTEFTAEVAVELNSANAAQSRLETRLKRDATVAIVDPAARRDTDPQSTLDADLEIKRAQAEVKSADDAMLQFHHAGIDVQSTGVDLKKQLAQAHLDEAKAKLDLARELDGKTPDPARVASLRASIAKHEDDACGIQQQQTKNVWVETDATKNQIKLDDFARKSTNADLARAETEESDAKDPAKIALAQEQRANAEALSKSPVQLVEMHDPAADARDTISWAQTADLKPEAKDRIFNGARGAQTELLHDANTMTAAYQQKAARVTAERDAMMDRSIRYGQSADKLQASNDWQTKADEWVTDGLMNAVPPPPFATIAVGTLVATRAGPGSSNDNPGVVRWMFDTAIGQAQEKENRALAASSDKTYRTLKQDAASTLQAQESARTSAAALVSDLSATNDVIDNFTEEKLPAPLRDAARLQSVTARGDLATQAVLAGRIEIAVPSLDKAKVARDKIEEPHLRIAAFNTLAAQSLEAKGAAEQSKLEGKRNADGALILDANGKAIPSETPGDVTAMFNASNAIVADAAHIGDAKDKTKTLDPIALGKPDLHPGMSADETAAAQSLAETVLDANDRVLNAKGQDAIRAALVARMMDPAFIKTQTEHALETAKEKSARDRMTFDRNVSEVDGLVIGLALWTGQMESGVYDAIVPDSLRQSSITHLMLLGVGMVVAPDGHIKDSFTAQTDAEQAKADGKLDAVFQQMGSSYGEISEAARKIAADKGDDAARVFMSRAMAVAACDDPDLRAAGIRDLQSFGKGFGLPLFAGTVPPAEAAPKADQLDASGLVKVEGSPLSQALLTLSLDCPEFATALLEAKSDADIKAALDRYSEAMPAGAKAVLDKSKIAEWSKWIDDNRTGLMICSGVIDLIPSLLIAQPELSLGELAFESTGLAARAALIIGEYAPDVIKWARQASAFVERYEELATFLKLSKSVGEMYLTTKLQKALGEIGQEVAGPNGEKLGGLLGQFVLISSAAKAQGMAAPSARLGSLKMLQTAEGRALYLEQAGIKLKEMGHKALWPLLQMAYQNGIVANIRDPSRAAVAGELGDYMMVFGPTLQGAVHEYAGIKQARAQHEAFCAGQFPGDPVKAKALSRAIDEYNASYKVTRPSRAEVVAATERFNATAEKLGLPEAARQEMRDAQLADWATEGALKDHTLDTPQNIDKAKAAIAKTLEGLIPAALAQSMAGERLRPMLAASLQKLPLGSPFDAKQQAAANELRIQLEPSVRKENMSPLDARTAFAKAARDLGMPLEAAEAFALEALAHYEGLHLADGALGKDNKLSDRDLRALSDVLSTDGATQSLEAFKKEAAKHPELKKLPKETLEALGTQAVVGDALARFEGTLIQGAKAKTSAATANKAFAELSKQLDALPASANKDIADKALSLKKQTLEKAAIDAFMADPRPNEKPQETLDRLRTSLRAAAETAPSIDPDAIVARAGLSFALGALAEAKVPLTPERVHGQMQKLGVTGPAADALEAQFKTAQRQLIEGAATSANDALAHIESGMPAAFKKTTGAEVQGPVEQVVREAYAQGLQIPPEAFDYTSGQGLDVDPRHRAFMADVNATLATQPAPAIEGTQRASNGDAVRLTTSDGDYYLKPAEKARQEVMASRVDDAFGLSVMAKTEFRTHDGKLVSAQRAVPDSYRAAVNSHELLTDPRYADGLSNFRAVD